MERDLIVVLVVILIIVFAILIIYRSLSVFLFFKGPAIETQNKKDLPLDLQRTEKKIEVEDEYRKIIEKSKEDYRAFMEKKAVPH